MGKCNIILSDSPSSDTFLHFLRMVTVSTLISQSGEYVQFHWTKKYLNILKKLYVVMQGVEKSISVTVGGVGCYSFVPEL